MARQSWTRNRAPPWDGSPRRSRRGFFDGRTLLFAGFSDSAGSAQINTRLAQRRAETVLEAVRAATDSADARVTLRAEAFGEVLPMACEDTDWGRRGEPTGRGLGGIGRSEISFGPKAQLARLADHEMIVKRRSQEARGVLDLVGHVDVRPAGRRVAGRVVVHEDQGRRVHSSARLTISRG
jgi:hypothetical protein